MNFSINTTAALNAQQRFNLGYADGYNAGFKSGLTKINELVIVLAVVMVLHVLVSRLDKTFDGRYTRFQVTESIEIKLEPVLFAVKNMLIAFLFASYFMPVVGVTGL